MDKLFYVLGIVLITLMATQCGSKSNTIDQKDHNDKNAYVYGDLTSTDGKQHLQTYPKDTVAEKRALEIREKLFGGAIAQGN